MRIAGFPVFPLTLRATTDGATLPTSLASQQPWPNTSQSTDNTGLCPALITEYQECQQLG